MDNLSVRPRATDSAELALVIKTKAIEGRGTTDDPCREVTQYWDLQGNLLVKIDPVTSPAEHHP